MITGPNQDPTFQDPSALAGNKKTFSKLIRNGDVARIDNAAESVGLDNPMGLNGKVVCRIELPTYNNETKSDGYELMLTLVDMGDGDPTVERPLFEARDGDAHDVTMVTGVSRFAVVTQTNIFDKESTDFAVSAPLSVVPLADGRKSAVGALNFNFLIGEAASSDGVVVPKDMSPKHVGIDISDPREVKVSAYQRSIVALETADGAVKNSKELMESFVYHAGINTLLGKHALAMAANMK